ncbi:glycosyltransferase family 4 protein [Chryseobacterium suipulveris]|uniref:Glycosyltransferase family 4 protein n=1 Tax=Chryseobacterium suipulveris TaxID=2929800 RepID=A0ABY4BQS4_9FLAO|nr:glycosyltransferase family 4 protein [Chryseobacterium suipulveris]UOE41532.1 glycosyltransferase family 4 protein [Chryseobacterium suipulveris]
MKEFVFFTLNDFTKEGGGTIRILGILNELAKKEVAITLISNIQDRSKVDSRVKHIPINFPISREDKRKIQFLLGVTNYQTVNRKYKPLLSRLSEIFSTLSPESKFIFCEYLDNSVGYWLKKNKVIPSYINDIHGVAGFEFDFQAKQAKNLKTKLGFMLRKFIAERLDRKVFDEASGIIYASKAMYSYYDRKYRSFHTKKNYHLPYLLNDANVSASDEKLVAEIRKNLDLNENDFIFLFAGAFKETGGVPDLIKAFAKVKKRFSSAKLIVIGDGPSYAECEKIVKDEKIGDRCFLVGRKPYHELSSYQEVADVIVCPDRQNNYSELIVHVKYLDALASGKLVINGSFKSVQEINQDKELSLLFKPSDINSLAEQMSLAITNREELERKFEGVNRYVLEILTYKNNINVLLN